MDQNSPSPTPSPTARRGGMRLPRRAAGPVVAVGVLASCLATIGGTAFAASSTPAATSVAASAPADGSGQRPPTEQQDVEAFVRAGYTSTDALRLAVVWGSPSVDDAKASAGAKLLAGTRLPTIPKAFTHAQDVAAFTASGYDRHDARHLARLWHTGSVHAAEVRGGAKLLAGDALPFQP